RTVTGTVWFFLPMSPPFPANRPSAYCKHLSSHVNVITSVRGPNPTIPREGAPRRFARASQSGTVESWALLCRVWGWADGRGGEELGRPAVRDSSQTPGGLISRDSGVP